ncbi:MAG: glucose-1-phosphate cytidylyltransferase [Alphaproteobacteria bacterium]|jgi:glucose-1-phosphate cytidylyltransferase|nr:glucose-1-phosphate cytidylyltransferase [Alphaproteobacteria bacterium]
MKVVILCGGQGTRIRDVAENIPKPMIPIGQYPILGHIMKSYAAAGHTDFVLCLGHLGHVIKDFFLNYEAFTGDFTINLGENKRIEYHDADGENGWQVTLADTGDAALTGARVKRIQKYVDGEENFMLTYGDGLSDLDLDALLDFHTSHGKIMTVCGVRPPGRFGELESDDHGKVTEFNEKPQATGGLISGGFFICRKEIFNVLDDREDLVFEQEPIRKLVADGEMMVYNHDGFWQCMDTARDHHLLNDLWATGKAPWKTWK